MKTFLKFTKATLTTFQVVAMLAFFSFIIYTAGLIDQDLISFNQSLERIGIMIISFFVIAVVHQIRTMIKYYLIEYYN